MNIALDYDETYTRDPGFWDAFVRSARNAGHTVWVVTMRTQTEGLEQTPPVHGVYFTARKAKKGYMDAKGLRVDVWIDDQPLWVLRDAA